MIQILKIYSRIFCLLLISVVEINAQAPGLLGKKLTVGYDVNLSFNLYGDAYNAAEKNSNSFGSIISTKHNFNVDYVISRSLSLGMDYTYARSGVDIGFSSNTSHNIEMREIGIRLKNFKRINGGIAPIGFYNQYRLFRLDYDTELVGFSGNTSPVIDRTAYGVSFAYGHQGVIVSNILYNIGFEMGAAFSDFDFATENGILQATKNFVNWDTFLKFKLGIVVPII